MIQKGIEIKVVPEGYKVTVADQESPMEVVRGSGVLYDNKILYVVQDDYDMIKESIEKQNGQEK